MHCQIHFYILSISVGHSHQETVLFICSCQTGFAIEEASQISHSTREWPFQTQTQDRDELIPKILHILVHYTLYLLFFLVNRNNSHKFLITAMRVTWACFQGWPLVVGDYFKEEKQIFPYSTFSHNWCSGIMCVICVRAHMTHI